jgi:3-hydroxybutyryl-CoA dehydrogenase
VRASVPDRVRANLRSLGRSRESADEVVERVAVHETLGPAVAGAAVVIEAAPEDLVIKQRLFERLGALTGPDTMLATNTSVMSVGSITSRARHLGRALGTHWWNPPYLIPLVEVVHGEATDDQVVERMIELLAWAGKTPVHVRRDVPGFVGNRLQHALWREAFRLVEDGICDPETVDVVVKSSFGRRLGVLGPIENADLVGLDLTLAIHEYLLSHLDRTPGPAAGLRDKVARGELGLKSGKGFRTWREGEPAVVRERLLRYLASWNDADRDAGARGTEAR